MLETLHHLKRETVDLRRAVWPLREVINGLTRSDGFFGAEVQPYLRDIYDHTVHVIESLEAIRDLIAGLLDIYLSTISNRVNQEVRVLTVIALIFMPSTLMAGIFGMNFKVMPLLDNPDGFGVIIGADARRGGHPGADLLAPQVAGLISAPGGRSATAGFSTSLSRTIASEQLSPRPCARVRAASIIISAAWRGANSCSTRPSSSSVK